MTRDVLNQARQENIWERARVLPDIEAAKMLREYFCTEYFPSLPEHELFTMLPLLREIAYLSPEEGAACIEPLRDSSFWADTTVEFFYPQSIPWQEVVEIAQASVAAGNRARMLGQGTEERFLQQGRIAALPLGSEDRFREESIYLLTEALTNAANAKTLMKAWWHGEIRRHDPQVQNEIMIRLWQQDPEAAVSWIETSDAAGEIRLGGFGPLYLFSCALAGPDPMLAQRILVRLSSFGNFYFFVAALRLVDRLERVHDARLLPLVWEALKHLESLTDGPLVWRSQTESALNRSLRTL